MNDKWKPTYVELDNRAMKYEIWKGGDHFSNFMRDALGRLFLMNKILERNVVILIKEDFDKLMENQK